MADYRGRFLWYELLTTQPKAAQDFYGKVVGWKAEPYSGLSIPYTVWKRGEAMVAGVMELPEEARKAGAPPHWLTYVGTSDVDATLAKALKAGARALMPARDVPTVGRVAVLSDPRGLVFGLYKPAQPPPPAASPQNGDCSWHELLADDVKVEWDFFVSLFGWEKHGEGHDMGPLGIYQEYGVPGIPFPLGGVFKKPAEMPAPPHLMLYFRVDDVGKRAELVKSLGGQVLNGPMEVPGGDFIVNCLDPQGAGFSLHHTARK